MKKRLKAGLWCSAIAAVLLSNPALSDSIINASTGVTAGGEAEVHGYNFTPLGEVQVDVIDPLDITTTFYTTADDNGEFVLAYLTAEEGEYEVGAVDDAGAELPVYTTIVVAPADL